MKTYAKTINAEVLEEFFSSVGGIEYMIQVIDRVAWDYVIEKMNCGDDCRIEAKDVYYVRIFIQALRECSIQTPKP